MSYGFQHVETETSFAGWRTMFVTLGCVTIIIGLCVVFFLPDTPMKAHWLSDTEKVALLDHVSVNQTGMRDTHFKIEEIVEALLDPQIYLLFLSVVLVRRICVVVSTAHCE